MAKKARDGFRFMKDESEFQDLKKDQVVNYCFFKNVFIENVDMENKKLTIRDQSGNKKTGPFWMALKYLEVEK